LQIGDLKKYNYRLLDRVKVKGKEDPVIIIEILDGMDDELTRVYITSKDYFEEGVYSYLLGEFTKAEKLFQEVININPSDKAARLYLERSQYFMKHPDAVLGIARARGENKMNFFSGENI
jgi:adenylate cyclase